MGKSTLSIGVVQLYYAKFLPDELHKIPKFLPHKTQKGGYAPPFELTTRPLLAEVLKGKDQRGRSAELTPFSTSIAQSVKKDTRRMGRKALPSWGVGGISVATRTWRLSR